MFADKQDLNKVAAKKQRFTLCTLTELREKGSYTRWVEELRDEISAFCVDGSVYVYSTVCPHFGGDFDFDKKTCHLTCRWHGWKFDLKTGRSLTELAAYQSRSLIRRILEKGNNQLLGCFPYKGQLKAYEFRIEGDKVELVIE